MPQRLGYPVLGFGLGLRSVHYSEILEHWPDVDWFEIISENYMDSQGRPRYVLDKIAERYPIVMHGVSLSIGSTDELNLEYLRKLKKLANDLPAVWVSDHVCWTGVAGRNTHDLLPIPFNEDTLSHLVRRIKTVQEILERPLILENPSSYLTFAQSTMSEWEFLTRMTDEADCGLLLDVNNVYVNSRNFGFDPYEYLNHIPLNRVIQIHVAGHQKMEDFILDNHGAPVIHPVWDLLAHVVSRTEVPAVIIERDHNIPALAESMREVLHAKEIVRQAKQTAAVGRVSA